MSAFLHITTSSVRLACSANTLSILLVLLGGIGTYLRYLAQVSNLRIGHSPGWDDTGGVSSAGNLNLHDGAEGDFRSAYQRREQGLG